MNIIEFTLILFVAMMLGLAAGVPIAFALGGIGVLCTIFMWGPQALFAIIARTFGQMQSFMLVAIPLFIFMGVVLEGSGLGDKLYSAMRRWMGPLRGGLAIGTVIICALIAAMTGISGAATVMMGVISLPAMLNRGYDKKLAVGCIAAGGALGVLIPPSVIMIIYGVMVEVSIGGLYAGGILPGLLLAGLFIIYIGVRAAIQPKLAPALPIEERATWKEKVASLKDVILPILLVIIVLGVIFSGVASPTEAAGIGAGGSLACAAIYGTLTWSLVKKACVETMRLNCMVVWIMFGASAFTGVYIAMGAPELAQRLIVGLEINRWFVMIFMQCIYLVLGCLLDQTSILMITVPIFVPVIKALGFDPLWFGILFVINMEMSFLTPPFGFNLFYMKALVPKSITMQDIYLSIIPFVILQALCLALVTIFPQIAMWLPSILLK
jgi:tripartite ATP-independent transporter DctM subunit